MPSFFLLNNDAKKEMMLKSFRSYPGQYFQIEIAIL